MSRRRAAARPCPNASKARYPDRVAAELHLAEIRRRDEPWRGSDKKPVRSYRCRCGAWHLTSRPEGYEL